MKRIVAASFLAFLACGSPLSPPVWPARPFQAAAPAIEGEDARARLTRRVHDDQLRRLEAELGPYISAGGVAVEGTVSSTAGSWRVVGARWQAHGFAGVSLELPGDPPHGVEVNCAPDAECQVSTSLPFPATSRVARTALAASRFEFVIGDEPDSVTLRVELAPALSACPDWLLAELRPRLASLVAFRDEDGRWEWTSEGQLGELASQEGARCCWDRGLWRARAWLEPRCPGRYGVEVSFREFEHACALCGEPPPGCRTAD